MGETGAVIGTSASRGPGPVGVWVVAARPATLSAAVVPVLVGSAVAAAAGHFRPLPFVAALIAAVLIQIGTNLANDYFDFYRGADNQTRLGPVRVTQGGLIAPERVRMGMVVAFGLAILVGLYLVLVGGWPILIIGLLCITAGVVYTAGPWPLAYHALGDLFVFIFFGPVAVAGTAYLHSGTLLPSAIFASLPVGFLVTAILVVNNLRDVDTDRAAGKYTLAVRVGPKATRIQFSALVVGAYVLPFARVLVQGASPWSLLPLLTLPLGLKLVRDVHTREGRPLNQTLKASGQLHLLFGLLFALSFLV